MWYSLTVSTRRALKMRKSFFCLRSLLRRPSATLRPDSGGRPGPPDTRKTKRVLRMEEEGGKQTNCQRIIPALFTVGFMTFIIRFAHLSKIWRQSHLCSLNALISRTMMSLSSTPSKTPTCRSSMSRWRWDTCDTETSNTSSTRSRSRTSDG